VSSSQKNAVKKPNFSSTKINIYPQPIGFLYWLF
jgi:hypothetical protein